MLTITGKAIGRRKPLFADFSVPPPEDIGEGGETTLRNLITIVVRQEVSAFRTRQTDRQFLRVLSEREIADAVMKGKVESGASEIQPQQVDEESAIATALQAFEDGMYLVVVDEKNIRSLDETVFLQPDSLMTFVRVSLLAGG